MKKYVIFESEVIIGAMLTRGSSLRRIAEYMCCNSDEDTLEYECRVEELHKKLKELKKQLFKDKNQITQERVHSVYTELQKLLGY